MNGSVVSLGDVNIDRTVRLDGDTVTAFEERYDWFPAPGVTRHVEPVPAPIRALSPDGVGVGGKGANQAIAAARAGADAELLGAVGPDADSMGVFDALRDDGVRTPRLEHARRPTGTAYVLVGPDGENRILTASGANAAVTPDYVRSVAPALRAASVVLLSNGVRSDSLRVVLDELDDASEPVVVFDPGPTDGAERVLSRSRVDVATPNDGEYACFEELWPDFDGIVVHKRGPGPLTVTGDGASYDLSPPSVEAADTTGAGDTLNGYLAAGLAAGGRFEHALEQAMWAAALSTTRRGVHESIPTVEEVTAFRERDG